VKWLVRRRNRAEWDTAWAGLADGCYMWTIRPFAHNFGSYSTAMRFADPRSGWDVGGSVVVADPPSGWVPVLDDLLERMSWP
jgi:hypothetical protein